MLKNLVSLSLRFRGVILVLAAVVIGYGIYVAREAKLDVFPNFVQPQVTIQTECPGLAPEDVEVQVTLPVEATINGLGEMESLRSESIEGLSIITAVFKESTEVFRARQTLAEKLAETSGTLPAGVKPPRMTPLTSATMDLLKIGLVSTNLSPMALRSFADWTLKPRLLTVPGVAKCSVFGGEVRQLQIQILPERLIAYDMALSDVVAAARLSSGVMGAGFLETTNQRITLQTQGEAVNAESLANVVILHTNGMSVRIKDVARVIEGAEPKFGDTLIQGQPGVLMTMSSQYGANTLEVTDSLEAALKEMRPVLQSQGIQLYPGLHRPATFIEASLKNMKHSLALGGILVAVVLFVLLGSIRTACISLIAIPLSLLGAIILMGKFGITLNTITLGGLAIALGEVVDDSIIDVENIYRRLREYWTGKGSAKVEMAKTTSVETERPAGDTAGQKREIFDVVLNASLEVRSAVVYATFIVALVFLPVLTMTGLQGSFFSPLAVSYVLATMASLVVALTVTPALSFLLFAKRLRKSSESVLQRWLKRGYGRLLGVVAAWPRVIMAFVALLCAAAAACLPFFGGEFLPEFREGHFVLQVFMTPGTSLPEMLRVGKLISDDLLENKNVATVEQQVGRAELGEDPWGPHRSEFHVELKPTPGEEQEKMSEEIRDMLKKYPGIQFEVLTFLGDRIGETISGETEPVVVNIFGENLDQLDAKAAEVAAALGNVPGHIDVKVKAATGAPRIVIRLRPERLTTYGFRPLEVLEGIQTAYQGMVVAQTHRGSEVAGVAVILDSADRQDPGSIGRLLLRSPSGTLMPLSELAAIFPTAGRFSILHEGGRRRQTVTCGTSGRDVASFVDEAKRLVASKVSFPAGTYAVFSGTAEQRQKAQHELLLHSAIAAVGILLLLSIVIGQWRNLFLVLANVPFALVGGVLAVMVSRWFDPAGSTLTIGSLVGFVTLFGITTRNSIMLISHFEHLVTKEGMAWGWDTAVRGASERLMPILITAIVTGLGLLPLAMGSGEAGREIEGPMAVVILGGLVTSTLLNLLVLPTLALRYGRFHAAE